MAKIPDTIHVALSFAGEDRPFVEAVAKALTLRGAHVFYDDLFQASLVGKELVSFLRKTYMSARYCVVFVSQHYEIKRWPGKVELPAILERSTSSNDDYLIPVMLDDTNVAGIPATTGFLDGRKLSPTRIGDLVYEKLLLDPKFQNEWALFYKLVSDSLFVRRFIKEFYREPYVRHARYDLGSATGRFYARYRLGRMLEETGIAEMKTNLMETEQDVGLYLCLTARGNRLRKHILDTFDKEALQEMYDGEWPINS